MKKMKRMAAAVAALAMTAALALPMTASLTATAASGGNNSISITATDDATHSYQAYQVFAGKLEDGVLTNITWGDGVNGSALLTALKADKLPDGETDNPLKAYFSAITDDEKAANEVAKVLSNKKNGDTKVFQQDNDLMNYFAECVEASLKTTVSGTPNTVEKVTTISGLPDGYYFVKDIATLGSAGGAEKDKGGAYTRFILQVVNGTTAEVTSKSSVPVVDKQVWDDNATDYDKADATTVASGNWGETADHAINEVFQFKLIATLPHGTELDKYDTYKLVFHDTLSKGVAYDGSVKITVKTKDGTKSTTYTEKGNEESEGTTSWGANVVISDTKGLTGEADKSPFTITITDVKTLLGDIESLEDVVVEVEYDAHLTDKAKVNGVSGSTSNENNVYLEYSNNPNYDGNGTTSTTTDDSVWVFTYEFLNEKVAGDKKPQEEGYYLTTAEFELYPGTLDDYTGNDPIKFVKNDNGEYVVAKQSETTGVTTTITSDGENGTFKFIGLDAGQYVLVEKTAPSGYNKADPIQVNIVATHKEKVGEDTFSGDNNVDLTITAGENNLTAEAVAVANQIIDEKGAVLPSTGGIGTTIFYVVGGTLVAGAGVTLITKKRMKKEEE